MANTEKTPEFSSTVRGYHHYSHTWFPQESEVLDSYLELENTFDMVAIKTCKLNSQIVGHLPKEISRVTKFLFDRGAVVQATLFTTHYRRSPLVQAGLKIVCKVSVKVPGTINNHLLMYQYFELVRSLYTETKTEVTLGLFLRPADVPCTPKNNARKKKVKTPVPAKKPKPNRVIRAMFQHMKRKNNQTNIGSTIVIDP